MMARFDMHRGYALLELLAQELQRIALTDEGMSAETFLRFVQALLYFSPPDTPHIDKPEHNIVLGEDAPHADEPEHDIVLGEDAPRKDAPGKDKAPTIGRPAQPLPDNFDEVAQRYSMGEITGEDAAKLLGMSHSAFKWQIRKNGIEKRFAGRAKTVRDGRRLPKGRRLAPRGGGQINLQMHTCPQCKKDIPHRAEWAYKIGRRRYCSWRCLQAARTKPNREKEE